MDWRSFTFDWNLDSAALMRDLVAVEAHRQAVLNLILPPDWRDQLDRLNRIRAVHGTTALEGNPLSEAEISYQMDAAERASETTEVAATGEQRQIRNADLAQKWVKNRFDADSAPLSVADILNMHRMITEGSDLRHNSPGRFRTFSVTVGAPELGGVHRGAPHDDVPRLMNEYVDFVNSRRMRDSHPVIRALLAHFFLVTIHPFGDGNGRVSRLVEAGILFQDGYNMHGFYGLSNYFYRNETAYKTTLQECRNEQPFDVGPFVRFGLKGFVQELEGISNFIKAKMYRVVYRAMLIRAFNRRVGKRRRTVNQREYSLLDFLIEQTEPGDPFFHNPSRQIKFSELQESPYIKAAYKNVTTRTFLRELERLSEMSFIKFIRPEGSNDPVLELDFSAIGKY